MRVLLITVGSHGDINPFIAIGRALRARGHEPVLMANPYYRGQIEEAGVGFEPVGEYLDLKTVGDRFPDLMHPTKGSKVVVETLVAEFAVESFRAVRARLADGAFDAVVHHHIALGGAWAAEAAGVPRAAVVLAPMMWMSPGDVIAPQSWSAVHPGWFTRWLMRVMMKPLVRLMMDKPVNRARRELGLAPVRDEYYRVTRTARGLGVRPAAANLGMWSPALRGLCAGDPEGAVICGFPWHDAHGEQEGPGEELERFFAAGEPPVLFTLGTAAVHVAGDFYERAAEACRVLGRRGLFLVGPGRQAPRGLPAGSLAVEYARFSAVMPRCAVNVHHGGIGSTGQGLRAGRPTVVIPHAHDQFDNAARLARHGVSVTVPRLKVTGERLAEAIRSSMTPETEARAKGLRERMAGEDGAGRAAVEIERLGER